VPAPLPFAIPVGSIVWSPHQMLRRGTASTDRSCEASWGLRERDLAVAALAKPRRGHFERARGRKYRVPGGACDPPQFNVET